MDLFDNFRKSWQLIALVLSLFFLPAFSNQCEQESNCAYNGVNIYLNSENIQVTNNEIIVNEGQSQFLVKRLNIDSNGIFIKSEDIISSVRTWSEQCPNGHRNLCNICGGCHNWCRYRCVCMPM